MHRKSLDTRMTEGVIWKHLVKFAAPMLVGLLFQQLYNTIDAMVVGNYVSKQALAAVGSTGSIINTLVGFASGLSVGAGVVISQYYGAQELKSLRKAVQMSFLITLILCAILTLAGVLCVRPMLYLMAMTEDAFPLAEQYLTIYFLGVSGVLIYNMGAGVLRAVGDSRRPLYFLVFSALLNLVLDLLFVIAFQMGVAGVAYATVISQIVSAVLVVILLVRSHAVYRLSLSDFKVDLPIVRRIVRIGIPVALQQTITAFSNVFVQSYINAFGTDCMAGYTAYNKMDVYIVLPMQSLSMASTTFVGQNYGIHDLKRARKGVSLSLTLSVIATAILTVFALVFRHDIVKWFNQDAAVLEYGVRFVLISSPFYVLMCVNQILAGALRGIGRSTAPTIIMLSSFVLFRQIFLLVTKLLNAGFVAVALAYPAGWAMCSLLMFFAYRRCALVTGKDDAEDRGFSFLKRKRTKGD